MAWLIFILALAAANLPWLTERVFIVFPAPKKWGKTHFLRLLEWLLWYVLMLMIALAWEYKRFGSIHPQDWEFYAVTFCLFMVLAFPGFVWHNDLRKHIERT